MSTRRARTSAAAGMLFIALIVALIVALGFLAAADGRAEPVATTIIVVRHSEKVDDSHDPPLSAAGEARALALVEVLEDSPPDAIYASQYRRTQDTVAPAARRFGLEIRVDPVEPPIEEWARRFAAHLVAEHTGRTVLVAGHSNTVPALAAALCGCAVEPIDDSVYDQIYVVTRAGSDRAALQLTRYGAASK